VRLFRNFVYSIGWGVWFGIGILATVYISPVLTWVCFGLFVILEGLAVLDSDPGDTLSEHVWAFYMARPARFNLVAGFTIWLVCLLMFALTGWAGFVWIARFALSIGLGWWLWEHFRAMGRLG
jgi:hypothetical protein